MSQEVRRPTSLVVSPKIMNEVNASQSMLLGVPSDARQKGTGDSASFVWTEQFKLVGSDVTLSQKNPDVSVFELKFKVPDDSPYPKNAGRQCTFWFRVNSKALGEFNTSDGQFKMSVIALGKLKMLAEACGVAVEPGTEVDWIPYYAHTRDYPAGMFTGFTVYARLVDKPGEDADGNPARQQEITKFVGEDKNA